MIYAVVWFDFVPLSLRCASAQEAITKARAMYARGSATLGLEAVALDPADNLVTLWAPDTAHAEHTHRTEGNPPMLNQSPRVLFAALARMDPSIRDAVTSLYKAGHVGPAVRLAEAHLAAREEVGAAGEGIGAAREEGSA